MEPRKFQGFDDISSDFGYNNDASSDLEFTHEGDYEVMQLDDRIDYEDIPEYTDKEFSQVHKDYAFIFCSQCARKSSSHMRSMSNYVDQISPFTRKIFAS